MFTLDQIQAAHAKVQSGADFPAYIQDLKKLGVTHYETFVSDGHTDYYGANNYHVIAPPKYAPLTISVVSNKNQFIAKLQAHQAGETNYPTFCQDAATNGVEKWAVSMAKMTCTYQDIAGNEILLEQIPQ